MRPPRWTPDKQKEFTDAYPVHTVDELCSMFSLSARTVYNLAKRFGIKPKRKSFTNFGKSYRRRAATIPVGTITYHKAGDKRKAFVITEEGRVPLHIHNWRQAGREIPEGYVLKFIDGNPENCDVSNLKLMTRGDIIRGWKKPAKEKRERIKLETKQKAREARKAQYDKRRKEREQLKQARKAIRDQKRASKVVSKEITREVYNQARTEGIAFKRKKAEVVSWEWMREAQRKRDAQKVMKTRPLKMAEKVAVRIDHRTIVFINPGDDREKVLARYKKVS